MGIISFIENGLEPAARDRAKAQLPAARFDPKQLGPNELYSIERSNELAGAIGHAIDDAQERYDLFIRCGTYIAEDAINTFLRLLVKFLKPSLFARKFGDFFRRAHTFGAVEAKDFTPQSFILEMSDVQ